MKNWRENDYSYQKLKLPSRPSKPRKKGLTAVFDIETDVFGWMGLQGMTDFLEVVGEYVDVAKFLAAHSLMLPHDYIKEKIKRYRDYDVTPMIGGVFYELAHTQNAVDEFILHVRRLGSPMAEISENYIHLKRDERLRAIEQLSKAGITVIYEFGRKHTDTPLQLDELIFVVDDCLNAGVDHIVIEQDEVDLLIEKKPEILEEIMEQTWFDAIFFEADQFAFPRHHANMIKRFGSDVNLCNVNPGQVMRLEDFRRGMGKQMEYCFLTDQLKTETA